MNVNEHEHEHEMLMYVNQFVSNTFHCLFQAAAPPIPSSAVPTSKAPPPSAVGTPPSFVTDANIHLSAFVHPPCSGMTTSQQHIPTAYTTHANPPTGPPPMSSSFARPTQAVPHMQPPLQAPHMPIPPFPHIPPPPMSLPPVSRVIFQPLLVDNPSHRLAPVELYLTPEMLQSMLSAPPPSTTVPAAPPSTPAPFPPEPPSFPAPAPPPQHNPLIPTQPVVPPPEHLHT